MSVATSVLSDAAVRDAQARLLRPPGMLTHTCYNLYTGEAPDHELIWGDYFLLQALTRWAGD